MNYLILSLIIFPNDDNLNINLTQKKFIDSIKKKRKLTMQQIFSPKIEANLFTTRLGKIFSNLSIMSLIFCSFSIFSFILLAFGLLLWVLIIILSVGTVFITVPNYTNYITSFTEIMVPVSMFFAENFLVFAIISIASSVISLVMLSMDKYHRHTARVVISSLVIIATIILIIVLLIGGKQ